MSDSNRLNLTLTERLKELLLGRFATSSFQMKFESTVLFVCGFYGLYLVERNEEIETDYRIFATILCSCICIIGIFMYLRYKWPHSAITLIFIVMLMVNLYLLVVNYSNIKLIVTIVYLSYILNKLSGLSQFFRSPVKSH